MSIGPKTLLLDAVICDCSLQVAFIRIFSKLLVLVRRPFISQIMPFIAHGTMYLFDYLVFILQPAAFFRDIL